MSENCCSAPKISQIINQVIEFNELTVAQCVEVFQCLLEHGTVNQFNQFLSKLDFTQLSEAQCAAIADCIDFTNLSPQQCIDIFECIIVNAPIEQITRFLNRIDFSELTAAQCADIAACIDFSQLTGEQCGDIFDCIILNGTATQFTQFLARIDFSTLTEAQCQDIADCISNKIDPEMFTAEQCQEIFQCIIENGTPAQFTEFLSKLDLSTLSAQQCADILACIDFSNLTGVQCGDIFDCIILNGTPTQFNQFLNRLDFSQLTAAQCEDIADCIDFSTLEPTQCQAIFQCIINTGTVNQFIEFLGKLDFSQLTDAQCQDIADCISDKIDFTQLTTTQVTELTEAIDFCQLTPAQITCITQAIEFTQLTPTQITEMTQAIDFCQLTPAQITCLTQGIEFTELTTEQITELTQAIDFCQLTPTQIACVTQNIDFCNMTPAQITCFTQAINFTELTTEQITEMSQAVDFCDLTPTQITCLTQAIDPTQLTTTQITQLQALLDTDTFGDVTNNAGPGDITTTNGVTVPVGQTYIVFPNGDTWAPDFSGIVQDCAELGQVGPIPLSAADATFTGPGDVVNEGTAIVIRAESEAGNGPSDDSGTARFEFDCAVDVVLTGNAGLVNNWTLWHGIPGLQTPDRTEIRHNGTAQSYVAGAVTANIDSSTLGVLTTSVLNGLGVTVNDNWGTITLQGVTEIEFDAYINDAFNASYMDSTAIPAGTPCEQIAALHAIATDNACRIAALESLVDTDTFGTVTTATAPLTTTNGIFVEAGEAFVQFPDGTTWAAPTGDDFCTAATVVIQNSGGTGQVQNNPFNFPTSFTPTLDGFYEFEYRAESITNLGSVGTANGVFQIGTTPGGTQTFVTNPSQRIDENDLVKAVSVELVAGTTYYFAAAGGGGAEVVNPSLCLNMADAFGTVETYTNAVLPFTTTNGVSVAVGEQFIQFPDGTTWAAEAGGGGVVPDLGLIVNAGETAATADDGNGTATVERGETIHFHSSDDSVDITVTDGSAIVDITVDDVYTPVVFSDAPIVLPDAASSLTSVDIQVTDLPLDITAGQPIDFHFDPTDCVEGDDIVATPTLVDSGLSLAGNSQTATQPNGSPNSVTAVMVPGVVELTRANNRWLYNTAAGETSAVNNVSPADTEWADASLATYDPLTTTFTDFVDRFDDAVGDEAPGTTSVMRVISTGQLFEVQVNSWQSSGGGGFSITWDEIVAGAKVPGWSVSKFWTAEDIANSSGSINTATGPLTTTNGVTINNGNTYIEFPNGETWAVPEDVDTFGDVQTATAELTTTNGVDVPTGGQYIVFPNGDTWATLDNDICPPIDGGIYEPLSPDTVLDLVDTFTVTSANPARPVTVSDDGAGNIRISPQGGSLDSGTIRWDFSEPVDIRITNSPAPQQTNVFHVIAPFNPPETIVTTDGVTVWDYVPGASSLVGIDLTTPGVIRSGDSANSNGDAEDYGVLSISGITFLEFTGVAAERANFTVARTPTIPAGSPCEQLAALYALVQNGELAPDVDTFGEVATTGVGLTTTNGVVVPAGGQFISFPGGTSWASDGSGGGGTDDQTASEVNITDAANNFTSTTVEGALAELADCCDEGAVITTNAGPGDFTTTNGAVIPAGGTYLTLENGDTWATDPGVFQTGALSVVQS